MASYKLHGTGYVCLSAEFFVDSFLKRHSAKCLLGGYINHRFRKINISGVERCPVFYHRVIIQSRVRT